MRKDVHQIYRSDRNSLVPRYLQCTFSSPLDSYFLFSSCPCTNEYKLPSPTLSLHKVHKCHDRPLPFLSSFHHSPPPLFSPSTLRKWTNGGKEANVSHTTHANAAVERQGRADGGIGQVETRHVSLKRRLWTMVDWVGWMGWV